MLKIGRTFTIETINDELSNINQKLRHVDMPIQWPSSEKYSALTGDAAIVQLFLHWAKKSSRRKVMTFIDSTQQSSIENFVRRPIGLIIAFTARTLIAKNKKTDITNRVRRYRNQLISEMEDPIKISSKLKGGAFAFICADHLKKYSNSLYSGNTPKHIAGYKKLARILLDFYSTSKNKNFNQTVDDFGVILHELVKNTHDHGRFDIESHSNQQLGVKEYGMDFGVRGLITRKVPFGRLDIESNLAGNAALKNYFFRLKGETKYRNAIYASVFDMGPGYASKYLFNSLEKITFEEEYEATITCFVKNATTKSGEGFGEGLALCLESLQKLSGMLILRTGRVNLVVNPSKFLIDVPESINQCISWYGDGSIHESPAISGTTLTMIVPI